MFIQNASYKCNGDLKKNKMLFYCLRLIGKCVKNEYCVCNVDNGYFDGK